MLLRLIFKSTTVVVTAWAFMSLEIHTLLQIAAENNPFYIYHKFSCE